MPEWTMASVSEAVSSRVMPRSRIAISSADAWYSGSVPAVTDSTKYRISAGSSVPPSRFLMMTSTARTGLKYIGRDSVLGTRGSGYRRPMGPYVGLS